MWGSLLDFLPELRSGEDQGLCGEEVGWSDEDDGWGDEGIGALVDDMRHHDHP